MRSSSVLTILSIAMLLTCSAHAQQEADELRATERERLRSLVDGDIETARRIHADDFQLINPSGITLSKTEYLREIMSGNLDYLVWEPDAIEVRRYGEAAVVRYQAQVQAIAAGQRTALRRFWHTDVYERRDGRWQAVWSQATLIQ